MLTDKIIKAVHEDIPNINSQLEQNTKLPTPKKYGAKGDGITDDTTAIILALENEDKISISDGIYRVTTSIKINPKKSIYGDVSGTILIDTANNFSVFECTFLNEIAGFNIHQTNSLWSGNLFEVSSRTLEGSNAPIYVNLRNKIHDLNIETNSDYGTFIEISAYKYRNVDGTQYTTYGMWNNHVYNINHKGYLEYFCRTYCYKKSGTSESPWITDNKFTNINGDYYGYGWFGSKNAETVNNEEYYNYNINAENCVIQCYTKSKNFALITGGYARFDNCIPYDWSSGNTSKQKAIGIVYKNTLPQISMNNTPYTSELINYNGDDEVNIKNKCFLINSKEKYKTENSFYIGYEGGASFPKYIRIAKFKPTLASYSTNIRFHVESSNKLVHTYSLTYLTSSKTLTSFCDYDLGYSFLYNLDSEGYLNIYIKITSSTISYFMSYDLPPEGSSDLYFMYLSVKDLGSNLSESGLNICIPKVQPIKLTGIGDISNNANYAGIIAYDTDKGLCGFGRKHYGASYIPIITTQEITATSTSDSVTLTDPKWGITPKIVVQPLSSVTAIPYPSDINMNSGTVRINNIEPSKKYLIVAIYNN